MHGWGRPEMNLSNFRSQFEAKLVSSNSNNKLIKKTRLDGLDGFSFIRCGGVQEGKL